MLIAREQYFIDLLNPDYNIVAIAGSSLGFKHFEESIAKISKTVSGVNNAMFGKSFSHTADTKVKISLALTGENHSMFGRTYSAETKVAMSEVKIGTNHSAETKAKMGRAKGGAIIYLYDSDGLLVNTFCSARKATEILIVIIIQL